MGRKKFHRRSQANRCWVKRSKVAEASTPMARVPFEHGDRCTARCIGLGEQPII